MSSPHDLAAELLTAFRAPAPDLVGTIPDRMASTPVALRSPVRFAARDRTRAPLLTVLEQRRSVRLFGPQAVAASLVADVVARGIEADVGSWPDHQAQCPLQTDVVAFRLDGLEPGMYSLDAVGNPGGAAGDVVNREYVQVAPLPKQGDLHDLTLQREFCDSAVIISIAADLDLVGSLYGAHGYRILMGRAAAAAYTMWLDAVALGLVGTVFAGFIPASVRRPLRSDGASRHQIFALALGGAPEPPPHTLPWPAGHG
ncbi:nitroreductase family protein [Streptomyces sp. SS162]|uniref:nitroreductase family protein n=1 Tax=Streptomyces sp. SS162 TaxID=3108484 RepID=UPI002F418052